MIGYNSPTCFCRWIQCNRNGQSAIVHVIIMIVNSCVIFLNATSIFRRAIAFAPHEIYVLWNSESKQTIPFPSMWIFSQCGWCNRNENRKDELRNAWYDNRVRRFDLIFLRQRNKIWWIELSGWVPVPKNRCMFRNIDGATGCWDIGRFLKLFRHTVYVLHMAHCTHIQMPKYICING